MNYNLTFNENELQLIINAIGELLTKYGAGLLSNIEKQLKEQIKQNEHSERPE